MQENSIQANVKLRDLDPDGDDIALQINMDQESGQLSIIKYGTFFAHLYIGADLRLKISYQELIGEKNFDRGEVAEIDLREVLQRAIDEKSYLVKV